MSRWKAAAIHLSISVTIGLVVGALLFLVWYPPPFFHAAGADELVLLLVGVDIVMGPLLTLILFKSGKKGLKFDLVMIALLQSTALVYGLSVVLVSRPVFLVAEVDRFVLVAANQLDPADLAKANKPEFRSLSWTGPRMVAAVPPPHGKQRSDILLSSLAGKDIDRLPQYYTDYANAAAQLLKRAKPLDAIPLRDDADRATLAQATQKTGLAADALVWLPITARQANLVMLMERDSGKPVGAVAVNPWPD